MAKAGYAIKTEAEVALTAATTKSILGVRAGSSFALDLLKVQVHGLASGSSAPGFEPVLFEVCLATFATNAPGTNSTTVTPVQTYGRVLTHGMTAARAWTAEPTALTVLDEFLFHPQTGFKEWIPFGATYDCGLNEGFVLRLNSDNALSVRATMNVERN